jgi:HEAT repeat protein
MNNDGQIADLIAGLDHLDKPTIRRAVDALIALAPASVDLQNILHQRLTEDGHRNYWPVAYVLGHLSPPSQECISRLIDALDHPEPDIRWAVALLLVRIAKKESAVADLLVALCASGTVNQKRMALYCIRDLALSDSVSSAALLTALDDADPTVRVAATICLKMRCDLDDAGKNTLLKVYVEDKDPRVRNAAAIALAALGSPSEEFLRALTEASESNDAQTRKAANAAFEILEKRRSASSGSLRNR